MKTRNIVIQATSFCNINCRYCYLPNRSKQNRISLNTINEIFKKIFLLCELDDEVIISWHAGEPFTLSPNFYKDSFDIVNSYNKNGKKITHCFQTNGTILTEKWIELLKNKYENISLGISMDGPSQVNDKNRVDKNGNGLFNTVLKNIEDLNKHNIPFHVISVVTKTSLKQPEKIMNFFVENKISNIGFNIEEIEGVNKFSSIEFLQCSL